MKNLSLGLALVLSPTLTFAQSTDAGTFLTFGDAIDAIIEPGRELRGCSGLDQSGSGVFFDADEFVGTNFPTGWSDLSPALQSMCQKPSNQTSGATLGGAFGSPFSTRTFLPLSINTERPTAPVDTAGIGRSRSNFASFITAKDASQGHLSFGITGSFVDTDTTNFGPGQSGEEVQAVLSYQKELSGGRQFGIALDLGRTTSESGTIFDFSSDNNFDRSEDAIQATLDLAADACNGLGPAERDTNNAGLSFYYDQPLAAASRVVFQGRLSHKRGNLSDPLCIYRVGNAPTDDKLFAGIIDSKSRQTSLDLAVTLQTRRQMFGGTVVPRIGLAAHLTDRPGYTQTETSAEGVSITTIADEIFRPDQQTATVTAEDTGLALSVDDAFTRSVSSEIGATFLWTVAGLRKQSVISFDIGYVHRFSDDKEVTAHFAGDGRETPTTFSFDSGPSDSDYFTVGLGYSAVSRNNMVTQISASALLGDQFEDRLSLGLSFGMAF